LKILGIIPARGGSKGIPKKNIKLLNGKPLIAYTIANALASNLDRVIVSTDNEEISRISKECGAEVIIRPDNLAEDKTPTIHVLQDAVSRLDEKFDCIMTLQPTSPLRNSKHINEAIKLFESDKEADSLVSIVEVPHNYMPEKLMSLDGKYLFGNNDIKRRQDLPIMYARNGAAIYVTKTERLNEYIFGGKALPYFMNKKFSFDLDDMEDWELLECLIKNKL
jgi:CMP-N,N'-diacetyllegionaminic acid synthase